MKKILNVVVAAGAAVACVAFAQQSTNPPVTNNTGNNANSNTGANTQPTGTEAAKVWQQANLPTENHIKLSLDTAGEWSTTTSFWFAPNSPAQSSTGKASFVPVLGGRFVQQEFIGQNEGQLFKGLAWFGYNNATKKFESVWIDNETTGMLVTTGNRADDGSITFTGNFADPVSGQKKATRSRMSWPNNSTIVFEMFDTTSDGSEFKSLEVTYTRVAPPKQVNWKAQRAKDLAPAGQEPAETQTTTVTPANEPATPDSPR